MIYKIYKMETIKEDKDTVSEDKKEDNSDTKKKSKEVLQFCRNRFEDY